MENCFKNELKDKQKELERLLPTASKSDKKIILETLDEINTVARTAKQEKEEKIKRDLAQMDEFL